MKRYVQGTSRPLRRAFTLIELLVVIAIIGILASLILPAIVSSRGRARQLQCLNNLRNVGSGLFQFATQRGVYPASGYWDVTNAASERSDPRLAGNSPIYTHPNQLLADPGTGWSLRRAGVLSPADSSGGQSTDQSGSTIGLKYSWVVELLPFIGNQNIYDAWDFSNTPATAAGLGGNRGSYLDATPSTAKRGNADLANTYIEVLVCPADITVQEGTGAISYVVNGGFDAHWILKTDFTNAQYSEPDSFMCLKSGWHRDNLRQMGLMFLDTTQGGTDARRRHSLDSIRDGVSFTVALSENINVGPGSVAGLVTNWACPYPQNTSFFVNPQAVLGGGFPNSPGNVMPGEPGRYRYIDSNNRGNLAAGDYDPIAGGTTSSNPCYVTYGDSSGVYNQGGINGDLTGIAEGNYPYPNSLHPGGVHVVMADGSARFIPENIAGDVWARLVTPNGSLLTRGGGKARDRLNFEEAPSGITDPDLYPLGNRQIPLSESEIP